MYLSRYAVVLFFFRLGKPKNTFVFLNALAVAAITLGIISIVVIATQQSHPGVWTLPTVNADGVVGIAFLFAAATFADAL